MVKKKQLLKKIGPIFQEVYPKPGIGCFPLRPISIKVKKLIYREEKERISWKKFIETVKLPIMAMYSKKKKKTLLGRDNYYTKENKIKFVDKIKHFRKLYERGDIRSLLFYYRDNNKKVDSSPYKYPYYRAKLINPGNSILITYKMVKLKRPRYYFDGVHNTTSITKKEYETIKKVIKKLERSRLKALRK